MIPFKMEWFILAVVRSREGCKVSIYGTYSTQEEAENDQPDNWSNDGGKWWACGYYYVLNKDASVVLDDAF